MTINVLSSVVTFILVIIFILLFCLIIIITTRYSYDATKRAVFGDSTKNEIKQLRKTRYSTSKMILQSFPDLISPEQNKEMMNILAQYKSVKNEKTEIEWERHWIPKMHSIMDTIQKKIPANRQNQFNIANKALEDNEQKINAIREHISQEKDKLEKFQRQPLAFILMLGNRLTSLTTTFLERREEKELIRSQAEENQRLREQLEQMEQQDELDRMLADTQSQLDFLQQMKRESQRR